MKSRNGSSGSLNSAAYRNTRDHLLRVRSSTLSRSVVQRITAANGSGFLTEACSRRCNDRYLLNVVAFDAIPYGTLELGPSACGQPDPADEDGSLNPLFVLTLSRLS